MDIKPIEASGDRTWWMRSAWIRPSACRCTANRRGPSEGRRNSRCRYQTEQAADPSKRLVLKELRFPILGKTLENWRRRPCNRALQTHRTVVEPIP